MLHAWVQFLCYTSLNIGMSFSNRVLYLICYLSIAGSSAAADLGATAILMPILGMCLDVQDVQAACAAVSLPVNVIPLSQGASQVEDYHQSAAGQQQTQLNHKPTNYICSHLSAAYGHLTIALQDLHMQCMLCCAVKYLCKCIACCFT